MKKAKRKILVVLVDRANYGRMRMVLKAIEEQLQYELLVIYADLIVLERSESFFHHRLQLPSQAY